MQTLMFIGGKFAGQTTEVADHVMKVVKIGCDEHHRYYRRRINIGTRTFEILVLPHMTNEDIFGELLAGYKL